MHFIASGSHLTVQCLHRAAQAELGLFSKVHATFDRNKQGTQLMKASEIGTKKLDFFSGAAETNLQMSTNVDWMLDYSDSVLGCKMYFSKIS